MQLALASQPATPGADNLDWAGAAACGAAVVLDGLTESVATGCRHGTAWYVRELGMRLLAGAVERDRPLADVLASALAAVAQAHGDGCDLAHPGSPGATVAIVRPADAVGTVEYLVLADAVVVLDAGGEPAVITDRRVDAHLRELRAAAAGPATEERAALDRLIEAQQGLRNQPGGYWVAGARPEAAGHAITGELTGVQAALLLSDGAALMASDFGAASWRELVDLAALRGPAAVIAATRELADHDPDRTVWPRYKTHDDATAILLTLPTPTPC